MRVINKVPLHRYGLAALAIMLGLVVFQFLHTSDRVKADDLPVVYESGWLENDTTWTAGNVYFITSAVTIPDGVTLTVEAGAIVKVQTIGDGVTVLHGGTLDVDGTSSNPAIFTSVKDDSVGGDTGGDGATTGGFGDYGNAIELQNGTANITHATIRYGSKALRNSCSYSSSQATVTDSTFNNAVSIGCSSSISFARNTFDVPGVYGATLEGMDDISGFKLSGTDKNNFVSSTASGNVVHVNTSAVADGTTWGVASNSGAILMADDVSVYGTLNLGSGVIVKVGFGATTGIEVYNNGTLSSSGSSGSPVIITSIKDDTIGGDSQGDGSTTGSAGDYGNAVLLDAGSHITDSYTSVMFATNAFAIYNSLADFDHATVSHVNKGFAIHNDGQVSINASNVSYASEALHVYDGANVAYRGSITNVAMGIVACDWQSYCSVDAAYTDWGSSAGPFATNPADNLACGSVTVTPWKHSTSTYSSTPSLNIRNCSGSSPNEELTSAVTHFNTAISARQIDCTNMYQDACDAMQTAYACLSGAVDSLASTTPFTLPSANPGTQVSTYVGDFGTAASTYANSIEYEAFASNLTTFASQMYSLGGTMVALANAYNNCAP